MYYVYLIKSVKHNETYIGSTNDLRRRLFEHNSNIEISTKRYAPWRLVYYEAYQSKKDAREREMKLKSHGNAVKKLKKRAEKSLKNSAGFTLIETLVAIVIFTLLMGAISCIIVMLYRTHNYGWQQAVAIDEARRGIKVMLKEIREARPGDDGSYPIEYAGDKEFIFYSDIDEDGETERVRYFLGTVGSGSQTEECVSFFDGGTCEVVFSDFSQGTLISAQVIVSVEGDFGWNKEYAEIYADGNNLGQVCKNSCSDCAADWQGVVVFDVTELAQDNSIQFLADANSRVDAFCDWQEPNHSMKVKFEFSWEEEIPEVDNEFKKGVINPTFSPVQYPSDQEEISIISSYVRNTPPIFEYFYFDEDLNQLQKIEEYPARLIDTKLMKLFLVINVDPNRPPSDFELESYSQLRNLEEE